MRADYQTTSDAELLQTSGADAEAFGVFYDRHVVAVLSFFVRRVGDSADAADLASETFVAAFLARDRYRDTGAPAAAWLFGIARRQLSHYVRHQRVSDRNRRHLGARQIEWTADDLQAIEDLVDRRAFLEQVRSGLDRLPPAQAEAVRLRVLDQLPYREIATRLGCRDGAARVRVCRGLSRLAALLGGQP